MSKLVVFILLITDSILLIMDFLYRNFVSQHAMLPTVIFCIGCFFACIVSIITKSKSKIN